MFSNSDPKELLIDLEKQLLNLCDWFGLFLKESGRNLVKLKDKHLKDAAKNTGEKLSRQQPDMQSAMGLPSATSLNNL